jgi:hypothetical protein
MAPRRRLDGLRWGVRGELSAFGGGGGGDSALPLLGYVIVGIEVSLFVWGVSVGEFMIMSTSSGMASVSSFGRRDSVDPLFRNERNERVEGLLFSASASSPCRLAILPLRSSSRTCHSGIDLVR